MLRFLLRSVAVASVTAVAMYPLLWLLVTWNPSSPAVDFAAFGMAGWSLVQFKDWIES